MIKSKLFLILTIVVLITILGCGFAGVSLFNKTGGVQELVERSSNLLPQLEANVLANQDAAKQTGSGALALATPFTMPTLQPIATPISDQLITQADAEELLLENLYVRINPSVVNILVILLH